MSGRKDKLIRKAVRANVNDQCGQYLAAMLGSPLLERLRYALVIIFRIGYRDLTAGGENGTGRTAQE